MQVGITLTVGMAHHIDGHTIDSDTDVCAMVKIESAQKQLLGLAAGMLGYEETRHSAENFLSRLDRIDFQVEIDRLVEMAHFRCECGKFRKSNNTVGTRGRLMRRCKHGDTEGQDGRKSFHCYMSVMFSYIQ